MRFRFVPWATLIALAIGLADLVAQGSPATVDLFRSGEGSYAFYRIPGIVVTTKGTVLAYCEARREGRSDWENIDLVMRRSPDGGKTWDAPRKVAEVPGEHAKNPVALAQKGVQAGDVTYSNPVAIASRDGVVHFLFCLEFNRCFYQRSDDDGATFSAPVEITRMFDAFRRDVDWKVFTVGPGHGVELKSGRLVVPVGLSTGTASAGFLPSTVATIVSDDHGRTWRRGEIAVPNTAEWINPNVPVVAELSNGRVMLNVRTSSTAHRRLVTTSPDGASGWSTPRFDSALREPICEGSLTRGTLPSGQSFLAFANPDNLSRAEGKETPGAARDRKNLSIKLSYDDGVTWPVNRVLEPGPSGYSDLAALRDGTLLCLYEHGSVAGNLHKPSHLSLARLPLATLAGAADPAVAGGFAPLPLAETIQVGGQMIALTSPPAGLVVRERIGLLTVPALDGSVVHRTSTRVLETRAVKTPGGDYLLMFPEGEHYATAKGRPKVNTMIAYRSSDGGRTWTGPRVAFDIDYSQHGFIPLIPRGSKRIYAFGTQPVAGKFTDANGQRENAPIGFRWSDDDGRTWSPVKLIEPANDPDFRGMSVMRMTETDAGTWLVGSHTADWTAKPLTTRQYLLRSPDHGETWTIAPAARPDGWFAAGFGRMDEGRPLALGGGKVFFMSRTTEGHLWSARSDDDGKTWTTPAPTSLVHPDAPPMLFLLSDGKTLAAFHHNRTGMIDDKSGPRSEMWVALSRDEGRTWSEPRFVFANALRPNLKSLSFNHQCSYLDVFSDEGVLHLFLPHRWQQVLHMTIAESALARLPTRDQLFHR